MDIPAPVNTTRPVVTILSAETGEVVRELHPKLSYGGMGAWSPDASLFVVRGADLKGRDGIVLVDALTGEARHVAYNETCSGLTYWAPDGASFFCYDDAGERIVQLNTSGAVLRGYPAEAQGVGVSPDGRYIVHWDRESVLRLLDLSTGVSREVIPGGRFTTSFPGWTPDGRSIVAYGRLRGDEALWFVPIDGRPPHKIDTGGLDIRGLNINPKTGQAVFNVGGGRRPQLEVWKMEGFLSAPTASR